MRTIKKPVWMIILSVSLILAVVLMSKATNIYMDLLTGLFWGLAGYSIFALKKK